MTEFSLQKALDSIASRRTEAQETEQNERNTAGRAKLDPNSPANRAARAAQMEASLHEELDFLIKEPDSDLKTMRVRRILDRLGELAAERGDFNAAATISVTEARKDHYKAIHEAVLRDESDICSCPDDLIVDRQRNQEIKSPALHPFDVINTADGPKTLLKCRKCGLMNTK
jgi:hypothetical protein